MPRDREVEEINSLEQEQQRSLMQAAQDELNKERDHAGIPRIQFFTHNKPFDKSHFTPAEVNYSHNKFLNLVQKEFEDQRGPRSVEDYDIIFDDSTGLKRTPQIIVNAAKDAKTKSIGISLEKSKSVLKNQVPSHAQWVTFFQTDPFWANRLNQRLQQGLPPACPARGVGFEIVSIDSGDSVTFKAIQPPSVVPMELTAAEVAALSFVVTLAIQDCLKKFNKNLAPCIYTHPAHDETALQDSIDAVKASIVPLKKPTFTKKATDAIEAAGETIGNLNEKRKEIGAKAVRAFKESVADLSLGARQLANKSAQHIAEPLIEGGQYVAENVKDAAVKARDAIADDIDNVSTNAGYQTFDALRTKQTDRQARKDTRKLNNEAQKCVTLREKHIRERKRLLKGEALALEALDRSQGKLLHERLEALQTSHAEARSEQKANHKTAIAHDPAGKMHVTQAIIADQHREKLELINQQAGDIAFAKNSRLHNVTLAVDEQIHEQQAAHLDLSHRQADQHTALLKLQEDAHVIQAKEQSNFHDMQQEQFHIRIDRLENLTPSIKNLQRKQMLELQKLHQFEMHLLDREQLLNEHKLQINVIIDEEFLELQEIELNILQNSLNELEIQRDDLNALLSGLNSELSSLENDQINNPDQEELNAPIDALRLEIAHLQQRGHLISAAITHLEETIQEQERYIQKLLVPESPDCPVAERRENIKADIDDLKERRKNLIDRQKNEAEAIADSQIEKRLLEQQLQNGLDALENDASSAVALLNQPHKNAHDQLDHAINELNGDIRELALPLDQTEQQMQPLVSDADLIELHRLQHEHLTRLEEKEALNLTQKRETLTIQRQHKHNAKNLIETTIAEQKNVITLLQGKRAATRGHPYENIKINGQIEQHIAIVEMLESKLLVVKGDINQLNRQIDDSNNQLRALPTKHAPAHQALTLRQQNELQTEQQKRNVKQQQQQSIPQQYPPVERELQEQRSYQDYQSTNPDDRSNRQKKLDVQEEQRQQQIEQLKKWEKVNRAKQEALQLQQQADLEKHQLQQQKLYDEQQRQLEQLQDEPELQSFLFPAAVLAQKEERAKKIKEQNEKHEYLIQQLQLSPEALERAKNAPLTAQLPPIDNLDTFSQSAAPTNSQFNAEEEKLLLKQANERQELYQFFHLQLQIMQANHVAELVAIETRVRNSELSPQDKEDLIAQLKAAPLQKQGMEVYELLFNYNNAQALMAERHRIEFLNLQQNQAEMDAWLAAADDPLVPATVTQADLEALNRKVGLTKAESQNAPAATGKSAEDLLNEVRAMKPSNPENLSNVNEAKINPNIRAYDAPDNYNPVTADQLGTLWSPDNPKPQQDPVDEDVVDEDVQASLDSTTESTVKNASQLLSELHDILPSNPQGTNAAPEAILNPNLKAVQMGPQDIHEPVTAAQLNNLLNDPWTQSEDESQTDQPSPAQSTHSVSLIRNMRNNVAHKKNASTQVTHPSTTSTHFFDNTKPIAMPEVSSTGASVTSSPESLSSELISSISNTPVSSTRNIDESEKMNVAAARYKKKAPSNASSSTHSGPGYEKFSSSNLEKNPNITAGGFVAKLTTLFRFPKGQDTLTSAQYSEATVALVQAEIQIESEENEKQKDKIIAGAIATFIKLSKQYCYQRADKSAPADQMLMTQAETIAKIHARFFAENPDELVRVYMILTEFAKTKPDIRKKLDEFQEELLERAVPLTREETCNLLYRAAFVTHRPKNAFLDAFLKNNPDKADPRYILANSKKGANNAIQARPIANASTPDSAVKPVSKIFMQMEQDQDLRSKGKIPPKKPESSTDQLSHFAKDYQYVVPGKDGNRDNVARRQANTACVIRNMGGSKSDRNKIFQIIYVVLCNHLSELPAGHPTENAQREAMHKLEKACYFKLDPDTNSQLKISKIEMFVLDTVKVCLASHTLDDSKRVLAYLVGLVQPGSELVKDLSPNVDDISSAYLAIKFKMNEIVLCDTSIEEANKAGKRNPRAEANKETAENELKVLVKKYNLLFGTENIKDDYEEIREPKGITFSDEDKLAIKKMVEYNISNVSLATYKKMYQEVVDELDPNVANNAQPHTVAEDMLKEKIKNDMPKDPDAFYARPNPNKMK